MEKYLANTSFIDFHHPIVKKYINEKLDRNLSTVGQIVSLYYSVRDEIIYSPYHVTMNPDSISASQTIERGIGYCIEKSLILAAVGRAIGVPSRLGFSIVRNHISTKKFTDMLRTDLFVFHGYNEFFLNNKWVKCTPAFNKSLCEKFSTQPLDFDGENDSIFQPFSPDGGKYMEYIHEYGTFDDFPYDLFHDELKKHYPHLFDGHKGDAVFAKEDGF